MAKIDIGPLDRATAQRCGVDGPNVSVAVWRLTAKGKRRKRADGAGGLRFVNGQCWMWFNMFDMKHTHPRVVIRLAREMLARAKALGELLVLTARDDAPHSRKLLIMLGAKPWPDPRFTGEIWVWDLGNG